MTIPHRAHRYLSAQYSHIPPHAASTPATPGTTRVRDQLVTFHQERELILKHLDRSISGVLHVHLHSVRAVRILGCSGASSQSLVMRKWPALS
jgi:hypothetical protein